MISSRRNVSRSVEDQEAEVWVDGVSGKDRGHTASGGDYKMTIPRWALKAMGTRGGSRLKVRVVGGRLIAWPADKA